MSIASTSRKEEATIVFRHPQNYAGVKELANCVHPLVFCFDSCGQFWTASGRIKSRGAYHVRLSTFGCHGCRFRRSALLVAAKAGASPALQVGLLDVEKFFDLRSGQAAGILAPILPTLGLHGRWRHMSHVVAPECSAALGHPPCWLA